MPVLCPTCRQALDQQTLSCANGHQFTRTDGVLALLSDPFGQALRNFVGTVARFRADQGLRLPEPAVYEALPFAPQVRANGEWRWRCADVNNILRLLAGREARTILDIGAWNGWLSHQLAKRGHQVTAIDFFADEYDGLGAKKFYSTAWQAIQMDLADLSILDQCFDVVIVNHGLHFFPQPLAHVAAAEQRVAPGGLLIVIGLQFYQDPALRIQQLAARQADFRNRYGQEMFLRPTKGYLDMADKVKLAEMGLRLKPYRHFWLRNLIARLRPTWPLFYFGWKARRRIHSMPYSGGETFVTLNE